MFSGFIGEQVGVIAKGKYLLEGYLIEVLCLKKYAPRGLITAWMCSADLRGSVGQQVQGKQLFYSVHAITVYKKVIFFGTVVVKSNGL